MKVGRFQIFQGRNFFYFTNSSVKCSALNHAITKPERVDALNLALRLFTHNNTHLHDYEIQVGADKALCLKLGYVVVTSASPWEELTLIGKCLLQIYQCSSEQRKRSFRNIGATELVPLLIQVLMNTLISKGSNISSEEALVLNIVGKVLRIYAKLESAKSLLIQLNHGRWLGLILQYCVTSLKNIHCASILCMEFLGLIKDLTFRSSASDKEMILSLQDGIFGGLLATICNAGSSVDKQIIEWFTAVIWNLVLEKSVCDQIMENERIHDFPILRYLLQLFQNYNKRQMCPHQIKIRRNATSAIGNILAHVQYQNVLFGGINEEESLDILPTLLRLVETEGDSIVRRRAMRTVRCLAGSDHPKIHKALEKEDMTTFLVEVISRSISMDDENDRDMQIQACQTICALMERMSGADWPRVETALLQRVETSNDSKLILAACSCLAECVKKSPWRRGSSCFSEMFWTRLEATASSDKESHSSIASLLFELAQLDSAREDESTCTTSSTLTNTPIVNTLNHLISHEGKDLQESRWLALKTIVLLAEKEANKRPLAENESLLSGLVNLCLIQPNDDIKAIAKQVIINLVPEL